MRTVAAVSSNSRVSVSRRAKSALPPTWDVATLFPRQGEWSESDYLDLVANGARVEWSEGVLEFLPMPTIAHDRIVKFLFLALNAFIEAHRQGEVFISTTKTKLGQFEIRMPDVLLILNARLSQHTSDYFSGADLVMEVVSGDAKSRKRDLIEKRIQYALAGISEYWVIDPKTGSIEVLTLAKNKYARFGKFKSGQLARSRLLEGFSLDVSSAFAGLKD